MKKFIISLLCLVAVLGASAKGGRYMHIGYGWAQTAIEGESIEKSDFAISLTKGTSFLFPKKGWVNGLLQVGVDAQWFDVNVAKYKSAAIVDENWDNMGSIWDSVGDELGGSFDFLSGIDKLGRWSVSGGMGVGPIVTVSPLAMLGGKAADLKASIYAHYKPTFSAYFVSDAGEMQAQYGFTNMWDFGGKITWKFIGIGVEGWWGHSNFKPLNFDFDFGDDNSMEDIYGSEINAKVKRSFASTRLYIYFNF